MKSSLVAFIILCFGAQLEAQAQHFSGWSLGLNLDRSTTATQFGGAGIRSSMGDAAQHASLQGAYAFALDARRVLGLGITVGLGDVQSGSLPLSGSDLSFSLRDRYAVYAEPGLVLGDTTLLYGKLAYLGAQGEENHAGETFRKTYAGIGYGAGVRTMLSARLYLQLELVHSDYEWKGSRSGAFRPVSTTGSIGLGWRF